MPIDPELLKMGTNLIGLVVESGHGEITAEVEAALYEQAQNPEAMELYDGILNKEPLVFVRRFSAINVTCNQAAAQRGPRPRTRLEKYRGNSRKEPSPFQYHCTNSVFGLPVTKGCTARLREHEASCKFIRRGRRCSDSSKAICV